MTTTKNKTSKRAEQSATPAPKVKKHISGKTSAPKKNLAPYKLMLLVTVIPRSKADFYLDLLQSFEVNVQLEVSAYGTASKSLGYLDADREKQALFSVIREDNVENALAALDERFGTIRGGKGIAFTVPFNSMVGVAAYQFLSNKQ